MVFSFAAVPRKSYAKASFAPILIEAIISLPPNLFYGTGIPACIFVINKNKPKSLENKILFINADAEYGEGQGSELPSAGRHREDHISSSTTSAKFPNTQGLLTWTRSRSTISTSTFGATSTIRPIRRSRMFTLISSAESRSGKLLSTSKNSTDMA